MDLAKERQRLLETDAAWARAASEQHPVDEVVGYWHEDGVVFAEGLPAVQGREALRDYVEESFAIPGFHIDWASTEVILSDDGTLACLIGDNTVTMDSPDGQPTQRHGRVVTVWRRGTDDTWRCLVDIFNSAEPPGVV